MNEEDLNKLEALCKKWAPKLRKDQVTLQLIAEYRLLRAKVELMESGPIDPELKELLKRP